MVNFRECGLRYMASPQLIARYNYSGPVRQLDANPRTQISYRGCVELCGTGNDWYDWDTSSGFITTWLFPLLGTLLQAPFESNAFWRTVKATCRWVGSPMASLAYVLWNINVSGKCAFFGACGRIASTRVAENDVVADRHVYIVDLATRYEDYPDQDSEFSSMRDSLYLLMNLNQYRMKPWISMTKEAEGLLRVMLFSQDLALIGSNKSLREQRTKLAAQLRANRKRGTVPIFISTLWFLSSLAISIQSAFGSLGNNTQAHDLAIGEQDRSRTPFPVLRVSVTDDTAAASGLLLGWFPVLILCTIVDRDVVASDNIRHKLNRMIDLVCDTLSDAQSRARFVASFSDTAEHDAMAAWVDKVARATAHIKGDFVHGFAGQGRVRFHYGAAHSILVEMERQYVGKRGRNWLLADERRARANLMLGHADSRFVWFDGRQVWPVLAAVVCVGGTGAGAFALSYFTPTIGLGCRSGGYLVFEMVAAALLLLEFGVWVCTSPVRSAQCRYRLARRVVEEGGKDGDGACATEGGMDALRARQWSERLVLAPLEAFNTTWLVYMLLAQTTGAFRNCACQAAVWGKGGGYIDFRYWQWSTATRTLASCWVAAAVVACAIVGAGMGWVVVEWCLQAHLSTEVYGEAMKGLGMVRRFRRVRAVVMRTRDVT